MMSYFSFARSLGCIFDLCCNALDFAGKNFPQIVHIPHFKTMKSGICIYGGKLILSNIRENLTIFSYILQNIQYVACNNETVRKNPLILRTFRGEAAEKNFDLFLLF